MKNNYFASREDLTPGYEEVYLPFYTVSIDGGKTVEMVLGRFWDEMEEEQTLEDACIYMGNYIIECFSSKKIKLVCRRINSDQETFEEKTALDVMEAAVATREIRKISKAEECPKQSVEDQSLKYARKNWTMVCKVCKQYESMRNLGRARIAPLIFILVFEGGLLIFALLKCLDVILPPFLECTLYVICGFLIIIYAPFSRKIIDMAIIQYWRCPYCKEALPTYQRLMLNFGVKDMGLVNMYNRIRGRSAIDMYGYRRVPKYVDICPCCGRRIDNISSRS